MNPALVSVPGFTFTSEHPDYKIEPLPMGTIVMAIVSKYDRTPLKAVVLEDLGNLVVLVPIARGKRFAHEVDRNTVCRPGELFPEQMLAKVKWLRSSEGNPNAYDCSECRLQIFAGSSKFPRKSCPNDECPSKWERLNHQRPH